MKIGIVTMEQYTPFYDLLEISTSATPEEVRAAYKVYAKKIGE